MKRMRQRAQGMTEYVAIVGLVGLLLAATVNHYRESLMGCYQTAAIEFEGTRIPTGEGGASLPYVHNAALPRDEVVKYRVSFGTEAGSYPITIETTRMPCWIPGLKKGTRYHAKVTPVDAGGNTPYSYTATVVAG